MVGSSVHRGVAPKRPAVELPLVDPRQGDVEDDASSTIQRSFLAIAGSLLTEISLPKLLSTALINGSWFVRKLKPLEGRVIVMHGHRHIDWIGACGSLKIVSAPSPIMGVRDEPTHLHIHTLAAGPDGRLQLLSPQRMDIAGFQIVPGAVKPPA